MNLRGFLIFLAAARVAVISVGLLCSLTSVASTDINDNGEAAIARLRELKSFNQKTQKESELRQEFFDRLIFQIDTHYKNDPTKPESLHDFLAQTFSQMAERQPSSPMYDFLQQAAQLMRLRQEKFENPIELTNRFIQAGGILKPLSAEQFLSAQAYSNGERSESAGGMDREQLGDFVDHLQEPRATDPSAPPKLKNVEIRE